MSPLEQLTFDFAERLTLDTGLTWSTDPGVSAQRAVRLGKRHLRTTKGAPHIVIVPEGGPLSAEAVRPGGNPRILLVRTVTLRFYLFGGKSLEATEALLHNAIRAARNCFHAAFVPGDEQWPSEDFEAKDLDGHLVSFSLTVQLPVYDLAVAMVEPPLTEQTGYYNNGEYISTLNPTGGTGP